MRDRLEVAGRRTGGHLSFYVFVYIYICVYVCVIFFFFFFFFFLRNLSVSVCLLPSDVACWGGFVVGDFKNSVAETTTKLAM